MDGCANGSSGSSGNETTAGDGGGGGIMETKLSIGGATGGEGGQFGEKQIMEVVLKQVVDLVEETEQQLEEFQDLV